MIKVRTTAVKMAKEVNHNVCLTLRTYHMFCTTHKLHISHQSPSYKRVSNTLPLLPLSASWHSWPGKRRCILYTLNTDPWCTNSWNERKKCKILWSTDSPVLTRAKVYFHCRKGGGKWRTFSIISFKHFFLEFKQRTQSKMINIVKKSMQVLSNTII